MTKLEQLERQFQALDIRQTSLETYIKLYTQKTDEQLRQQREEIKEIRQDIKDFKTQHSTDIQNLNAKIDERFAQLDSKMGALARHNQILIGTMIGLAIAILITK